MIILNIHVAELILYSTCPLNPVNLLINMQAQEYYLLKGSDRFLYLYYKRLEIFKENLYVELRGKYINFYTELYIRGKLGQAKTRAYRA